ncbi:MAG: SDR family NAD(P)-dependent oxidoreductase [Hyphomicrobium sp.]|nr:SDR family NAD(P)-dependent oxidoreductase [Hyphomicrobium sp.]
MGPTLPPHDDPPREPVARERDAPSVALSGDLEPVAVVTGGSRGIGRALAERLARNTMRVVLVARDRDDLASAAQSLTRSAVMPPVDWIALDLARPDAPATLLSGLASRGFWCHTLVHCAGVGHSGAFSEAAQCELDAVLDLNVTATTRLVRAMLPGLLRRRTGGVLTIASLGGYVPGPGQATYYASKAYQISLMEALAAENAATGVRFSVVVPGPVDTGFHADMGAEAAPYRRWGFASSPEAVARIALLGYKLGLRVIPTGPFGAAMIVALRVLPHRLSVPIVKWLLSTPNVGG